MEKLTVIMGEFFKPLRRKIGLVTLGLACVFMAGWVRSLVVQERIDFRNFIESDFIKHFLFPAANHRIAAFATEKHSLSVLVFDNFTGTTIDVVTFVVIPFWSIAIPLTLLSAWLLLSKPRLPKSMPPGAEKPR